MGVSLRVNSWGHLHHGSSIYTTSTYILHHTSITSYCITHYYIILHHTSIASYCITHLLHHIASHIYYIILHHTSTMSYCITNLLHHIASLQLAQYCISSHHRTWQYMIQEVVVYSAVGWGVVRCTLKDYITGCKSTASLEQPAHRSVKSSLLQVPQAHRAISCTRS